MGGEGLRLLQSGTGGFYLLGKLLRFFKKLFVSMISKRNLEHKSHTSHIQSVKCVKLFYHCIHGTGISNSISNNSIHS